MTLREIFNYLAQSAIICFVILSACDPNDPCDDIQGNAYSSSFNFNIVDQSGGTLIGVTGTLYESDDVSVENGDGVAPPLLNISDAGSISFSLVDQGESINQTYDKNFYLLLPPTNQFPQIDIDTINISYLISENNDCSNATLEDLQIQYNDSLYNADIFPDRYNFLKL